MANEQKDKVMELVEKRLAKKPNVETSALYEEAKKVDASIGELTLRQFHARYPLQVKRRLAASRRPAGSRRRRRRTSRERVDRGAVRKSLLRFAQDVTSAEGTAEVIDVLQNIDKYVDEITGAVNGRGR